MNDELFTPEDQRLLDRLVDGELDEAERRALLLRLDQAPQGWRRCALAFLEAQSWRSETRAIVAEPPPIATANEIEPAKSSRFALGPVAWIPLAMAAGFVLTFVLLRDREGRNMATHSLPPAANIQIASDPPTPENLRLVVNGGAGRDEDVVEVPLVGAQQMNEALFGNLPQSLPPEVVQMLEQSGHQVVRERRLVPVQLQDGRRVVVPMDQDEIHPVSSRGFQ